MSSPEYNATVTMRADLAPGTMVLRVKLDNGSFPYEPGQYTVLGLHRSCRRVPEATGDSKRLSSLPHDHLIRRVYSITSNSKDEELEFVVTLVKSGDLTPRLFALREGGRLYVEPRAQGIFTLRTASGNRDLLMVATGSALAPYMSMLRSHLKAEAEQQFAVVHAAQSPADLAFRAQLEDLSRKAVTLNYVPTITDPDAAPGWEGLIGPVEDLLDSGDLEDALGIPIDPDRFDVFLSGAPDMIDALLPRLAKRGFTVGDPADPATDVHVERYW